MGTNYYLRADACPHCGRSDEDLHIGKSSAGWCFSLHIDPERGINSLKDWKRLWAQNGARIFDEYGKEVSPNEMLEIITKRATKPGTWSRDALRENSATLGPNNLARHRWRVGDGGGQPYDLLRGEFS